MKKRIIIIISIMVIGIAITMLYNTFATSNTIVSNDDVYDITLTGTNTVNIPKKSSKIVYYQICNTNKGKVKYGVGYTIDNSEIKVKVYYDSIDPETGIIDYGDNKFIKLKISNNSTSDGNVTLSTVLGYEYGGDLIPSSGVTLVTEKVNETNYLMQGTAGNSTTTFLRSTLTKEQIGSITFTNDNIAAEGMTSVDVSKDSDGTVLMWYGEANSETGLYDIYIGSENGITSFYNGYYLFSSLTNMTSINLKYIDTSKATLMDSMFFNCLALINLNLYDFNTANVESMAYMFYGCNNLKYLNLSNFDTSNVTSMESMFSHLYNLEVLDLSMFDTSNVTNMYHMFSHMRNLKKLNLSNFDTSKVTTMDSIFWDCLNLTNLNISNFNTSNVTNMKAMFSSCQSLTLIDFRNADFSNVTNYASMFDKVPTSATIYVKDSTQKDWIESRFTTLTGVTSVS